MHIPQKYHLEVGTKVVISQQEEASVTVSLQTTNVTFDVCSSNHHCCVLFKMGPVDKF